MGKLGGRFRPAGCRTGLSSAYFNVYTMKNYLKIRGRKKKNFIGEEEFYVQLRLECDTKVKQIPLLYVFSESYH